jgi:hypothetical protein
VVFAQHDRWQRRSKDSRRRRRRNAARPGELRIALRESPFTPRAELLAVSWTAAALKRRSQDLLGTEHALESGDASLHMLVERAAPQTFTMISQRFNRLRKQPQLRDRLWGRITLQLPVDPIDKVAGSEPA